MSEPPPPREPPPRAAAARSRPGSVRGRRGVRLGAAAGVRRRRGAVSTSAALLALPRARGMQTDGAVLRPRGGTVPGVRGEPGRDRIRRAHGRPPVGFRRGDRHVPRRAGELPLRPAPPQPAPKHEVGEQHVPRAPARRPDGGAQIRSADREDHARGDQRNERGDLARGAKRRDREDRDADDHKGRRRSLRQASNRSRSGQL